MARFAALVLALLASPAAAAEAELEDLVGRWAVTLAGAAPDAALGDRPSLAFSPAGGAMLRFAAQASCNAFHGTLAFEGGQLALGDVAGTGRACETSRAALDAAFLVRLRAARSLRRAAAHLVLADADGAPLLYLAPLGQ